MTIDEVYDNLQRYVVAATGLDSAKVIFANQSTARPLKPFLTIQINSFKRVSSAISKELDDEGKQTSILPMKCSVSFQVFSDKLHDAEIKLQDLLTSFDSELRNEIFKGKMSLLKILKDVTPLPIAISDQIESRAILDLEMMFLVVINENVGIIEKVMIDDKISNQQYEIQLKKDL